MLRCFYSLINLTKYSPGKDKQKEAQDTADKNRESNKTLKFTGLKRDVIEQNEVADFRTLSGSSDPAESAEGPIRKAFATSKGENAIHGSDSAENGRNEIAFFFAESELVANRA